MTDAPNRHTDTGRNKILIGAVRKLDEIINRHDPEIDVTVNAGVWNALDQLCHSLETAAERRGYARGIREAEKACVGEYLEDEASTEDDAAYDRAVADCIMAVRVLSPTPPAPVTVQEAAKHGKLLVKPR